MVIHACIVLNLCLSKAGSRIASAKWWCFDGYLNFLNEWVVVSWPKSLRLLFFNIFQILSNPKQTKSEWFAKPGESATSFDVIAAHQLEVTLEKQTSSHHLIRFCTGSSLFNIFGSRDICLLIYSCFTCLVYCEGILIEHHFILYLREKWFFTKQSPNSFMEAQNHFSCFQENKDNIHSTISFVILLYKVMHLRLAYEEKLKLN